MQYTKYGQVNKFQESLISSDAYKRKEKSAHISFLAQQMDFDSKPTKCSFTDAHNVAILSHKGRLCSYANRRKIYARVAVTTFREERTALASLQTPVFTNGYAYRNCWPRSIILQFGDPFLGQFGKL